MKRSVYALLTAALLITEILIGLFATGWVRYYLGDVLVVILIYTIWRTVSPEKPSKRFVLPAAILVFASAVEFLQMWGFCDRLGIKNRLVRTIIGTGFSVTDLGCYVIGLLPCFVSEYLNGKKKGC